MNSKSLGGIVHAYRLAISELSVLTDELSSNVFSQERHSAEITGRRSPNACLQLQPRTPRLPPEPHQPGTPQFSPALWTDIGGSANVPEFVQTSTQRSRNDAPFMRTSTQISRDVSFMEQEIHEAAEDKRRLSSGEEIMLSQTLKSIFTRLSNASTQSTNSRLQGLISSAGRLSANEGRRDVDAQPTSLYCDVFSCAMAVCNLIVLGWDLQHHFSTGRHLEIVAILDILLCVIFLLEILCRLCLERWYFISGVTKFWNLIDIVVFTTMLTEIIVKAADEGYKNQTTHSKLLRTISLLRMFRIFRFVKMWRCLSYFRSGRLLVLSLMHGSSVVAWFCIFSLSSAYVFSLLISSRSVYLCDGMEDELLCEYFGSVWISCSSMYQAMLGFIRWGVLHDALQVLEPFYNTALFLFVSFYYSMFMLVLTGISVVNVIRQAEVVKNEESMFLQQKWEIEFLNDLSASFKRLDINGNGSLCKDEMAEMLEDMEMRSILNRCNLDTHSAEALFDLIDVNRSGEVSFYTFAMGLMRLRGQASAVGLEILRRDIWELRSELRREGQLSSTPAKKPKIGLTTSSSSVSLTALGTSSRSQVSQRGTVIHKTEMRAMLLEELEDVVAVVSASCASWKDMKSQELLTPEKVNLYHFSYYDMSPKTAASSITLTGLLKRSYPRDGMLSQRHSRDSSIIGEARIIQDVYGTDVQVRILRGMFFPHIKVYLDLDDECGIVEQVENNGSSTSYKELIASSPARPDWFCSHWWGEPIVEFVACCQAHFRKRFKNKYWVCAYANRQHELSSDINDDPEETSFRRAMALAEGTLLILDSAATPFTRIWCDFEIFTTISQGRPLDIVTLTDAPRLLTESPLPGEPTFEKMKREYHFPLHLLHKGMQVELEKGNATMDQDKTNILYVMGKTSAARTTKLESANKSLRGYFALAAWPQTVKRGLTQNLLEGISMSLAQIVCADEDRVSLQLTLSGLKQMNDEEMKSIADCLPPRLHNLNLGLENCTNISDAGVVAVVEKLHMLPLERLELDFVSCYHLTDASLVALASKLPSSLTSMKLHFDHCYSITQDGVRALAKGLPNSAKAVVATFKKTRCNETFTSVRLLRKF